jgi:glycosyltransferase involved in cell wall biosynthesis
MRIGIDARFYGITGKGLGRYASELISGLERVDHDNDYVVFLRRANFDDYRPRNPRFSKALAEFPWYGWREQLLFPLLLKRFRLDLMHFCHFNVPLLYRGPFVVTVHDLILLSHPTPRATTLGPLLFRMKYAGYRLVIRRALASSRRVIAVSNHTKKEIVRNFPGIDPGKIEVTYEACGSRFNRPAERTGRTAGIEPPFMLYVGNAYPHKNLERLIEAFTRFRSSGFNDWKLVLVGGSDYFYDRLGRESRKAGRSENVVFYGRAEDEDLAPLYDTASFYIFPSLCEGFGLPPLEAMCRNLPVASSSASCLPEILGDAAVYFNPEDASDMVKTMKKLAGDPELRRRLTELGKIQAAKYDWGSCAKSTLDIYLKSSKP